MTPRWSFPRQSVFWILRGWRPFRAAILVDGATTRRYLCDSLAQGACGDGYGVTTGQDKPLKPGGTGHHALVNPFQIYFPENCKTGTLANFWRLRSARCWAGDAAHGGDVIMRCQMTSTTDSESRQAYGTRPKLGIKKVHLRQTAKTGVVINTPRPFPLVFGF